MDHLQFTTQQTRDGYWQWCARPPHGDHVHGGFETEKEASADAIRWLGLAPK